ncbi:hypothetical protein M0R04_04770 [Candidatus Dojkabacteria bacterium]|nr:hypothetical protein [Candidatus Dojkabacteria bacterium]
MNRQELIEKIAEMSTEETDPQSLKDCFYNSQVEYMKNSDDKELLEIAKDWGIELKDINLKSSEA